MNDIELFNLIEYLIELNIIMMRQRFLDSGIEAQRPRAGRHQAKSPLANT